VRRWCCVILANYVRHSDDVGTLSIIHHLFLLPWFIARPRKQNALINVLVMKAQHRIRYISSLYFCVSCSGLLLWHGNGAGYFPRRCQQRITVNPLWKRQPQMSSFFMDRSPSSLSMFLPPGDGNNDKSSEVREVTSAILTFAGMALFFISPLGGIFFALFNSFLAFVILLPVGAFAALNVWQYFNTVTGTCPNCGAGMKALKDESPTICLNCGSIVQAKGGQIYLANTNNEMMYPEPFLSFDDDRNDGSQTSRRGSSKRSTIIDVDVKEIDD
jgi:hypothetical protein